MDLDEADRDREQRAGEQADEGNREAWRVGKAAAKAGMDCKTARKYVLTGKLPSELKQVRTYRTRPDPIAEEDWSWVEERLAAEPSFEVKTLFELLQERRPGVYDEGKLRTLQRKVRIWRATKGPEKHVFFPQEHRGGRGGADGLYARHGAGRDDHGASGFATCSATSCFRTRTGNG